MPLASGRTVRGIGGGLPVMRCAIGAAFDGAFSSYLSLESNWAWVHRAVRYDELQRLRGGFGIDKWPLASSNKMTESHYQEMFEGALVSDDRRAAFLSVLRQLLAEGLSRERLLDELKKYSLELRQEKRDADEDLVLDMMDGLSGWSSPSARI